MRACPSCGPAQRSHRAATLRRAVPQARDEDMRSGLVVGMAMTVLTLAGCANAHERDVDSGPFIGNEDVGPVGCRPTDPPPFDAYCFSIGSDHVCGDAGYSPTCSAGRWSCPPGTARQSECWCSGFAGHAPGCICTPSGWTCPPDGIDAGTPDAAVLACPPDPSTLVGMPCADEGASCGSCPSPCSGFCNLATCIGHTWQSLEFGCADTTFACGPIACGRWSEVCRHVLSDVVGTPDDYRCAPFPQDCGTDCSCFPPSAGAGACADDHAGGVTLTLGGG